MKTETTKKRHNIMARLLAVVLSLSLIFMLGACDGNTDSETGSGAQSASETSAEVQSSSDESSSFPITADVYYHDGILVTQTYEKVPERVVVCGQTTIDLMVYFGLEDLIVGVCRTDDPTALPAEYQDTLDSLPVITEGWPTREEVVALQPDLIATNYCGLFAEDSMGTLEELNGAGTNIYSMTNMSCNIDTITVDDYFDSLTLFGQIFGIEDQMDEYLQTQRDVINDIEDRAAQETETPSVLLLIQYEDQIANNQYINFLENAIGTDLIRKAGGEPVLIGTGNFEASLESIIQADPDIILLYQQGTPEDGVENFKNMPEFQSLSAVKNDQVRQLDASSIQVDTYGINISDSATAIAQAIHPEWYEDE